MAVTSERSILRRAVDAVAEGLNKSGALIGADLGYAGRGPHYLVDIVVGLEEERLGPVRLRYDAVLEQWIVTEVRP